jgi:hypothetical protein
VVRTAAIAILGSAPIIETSRGCRKCLDLLEKVSITGRAELDKTYDQVLNTREGSLDRQNARAAYSVILCACRELTFEELAMAVRCQSDSDKDDKSVAPVYVAQIFRDCLNKSTSGVAEFAHVSVKEFSWTKRTETTWNILLNDATSY